MPNAGEMKEIIVRELQESAGIKRIVAHNLSDKIASAARMIVGVYKAGGKMLLVGIMENSMIRKNPNITMLKRLIIFLPQVF